MNDLLRYLVPIILVGYIAYNVFRIMLHRKLNKERLEYEQMIEKKMKDMQADVQARSRDLQDSIQMINQEYSKVMQSMSLQQRQDAETLVRKMNDFKQKQSRDSSSKAPPTTSDPLDS